ncbi:MAG: peptide chain release factor 1 [Deltaproteobacteria bacterium]|jgi:peptide chain release factor 1|nr:peptide chain release factor 1 [Deltaproteobacteria bacterium]MBW2542762.1 peptide chain release factor 1 [Deltaproteobacteria bacterium]
MSELLEKISVFESKATQLEERLADPGIASVPAEYASVAKELSRVRPLAETAARYRKLLSDIEDAKAMLEDDDAEVCELAEGELAELEEQRVALEREIRLLLVPKDPNEEKNAILEVRAGTGGDEAALFAADLFRMYSRYAESRGWKIEPLSISQTDAGGIREVIVNLEGEEAFGRLRYECGVHRVQRVPSTESQGRIHTSTVTVAVLPEAKEVDVAIDPNDIRVDRFRSSGPGGQSVNTTDSAIRITHLPTGLVVQCQDEKSQHKNKAKAFMVLRSRLYDLELQREAADRAGERRAQVGTGERSEKIRTYNYPQTRVTDHRAGITLHRLTAIMEGDLDELIDGIRSKFAEEELAGDAA